jgi:hypothetical protein
MRDEVKDFGNEKHDVKDKSTVQAALTVAKRSNNKNRVRALYLPTRLNLSGTTIMFEGLIVLKINFPHIAYSCLMLSLVFVV